MQDENRFFRFLGRVNALLLTACGIGVLGVLAVVFMGDIGAGEFAGQVAVHPGHDDPEFSYDFSGGLGLFEGGTLTVLDGTHEAMMILQRVRKRGGEGSFSGRYSAAENVNVMIVDLGTAHTRWLFKGTDRAIDNSFVVHGAAVQGQPAPVLGLLMAVADADSNGDGKLNGKDDASLYLYRPGDATAVKIVSAKAISSIVQPDPGKIVVTYYDGKDDRIVFLSTADFKPAAQGILSATPN